MKKLENSYERARAYVKGLKGFYNHLFIYVLFLLIWFLFAKRIFGFVTSKVDNPDEGFFDWVDVNLWLNPLIWGMIVLFHGLYVYRYKFSFFEDWEKRKIQEFMEEESTKINNRYE